MLTGARRWRAYYGKDANGLAQGGGDVRAWVLAGLGAAPAASASGQAPTAGHDLPGELPETSAAGGQARRAPPWAERWPR